VKIATTDRTAIRPRHRTNLDRTTTRARSRYFKLRITQYDSVRLRHISRMGNAPVTRLGENTADCDVLSEFDRYGVPRSRYPRAQSRVGLRVIRVRTRNSSLALCTRQALRIEQSRLRTMDEQITAAAGLAPGIRGRSRRRLGLPATGFPYAAHNRLPLEGARRMLRRRDIAAKPKPAITLFTFLMSNRHNWRYLLKSCRLRMS